MKRILIVCLLGMGLLLPSTTITAKEFSKRESAKRFVDVWLEGATLQATSDAQSGTLVRMKIFNTAKQLVLNETLSGYEDAVDVSGLPNGFYSVQVFTTNSPYPYSENIYI